MSGYSIEIIYTSNSNKSAKINIKGNGIDFTDDIVIPKSFHEKDEFNITGLTLTNFIIDNQIQIKKYNDILGDSYFSKKLVNQQEKFLLVENKKNNDKSIVGFENCFTVSEKTMKVLKQISKKTQLNIVGKSKWMMLGQKDIIRENSQIIDEFKNLGKNLSSETLEKSKPTQKKYFESNSNMQSKPKKSIASRLGDRLKSFSSGLVGSNTSFEDQMEAQRMAEKNRVDFFDSLFNTCFPTLAPMYRPTSGLAWMMLFLSSDKQNQLIEDPLSTIQEVKGFENVKSAEVDKRDDGSYKINLYEDENKTKELATMIYSQENGLKMLDKNGHSLFIKPMEEKNGYAILTESENQATAYLELIRNNDDYVGNWTIQQNNSVPVSSYVAINEDYSMSSNTQRLIDLDSMSFTNNDMRPETVFPNLVSSDSNYTNDYNQSVSQNYDLTQPLSEEQNWNNPTDTNNGVNLFDSSNWNNNGCQEQLNTWNNPTNTVDNDYSYNSNDSYSNSDTNRYTP